MRLIRARRLVEDTWQHVATADALPPDGDLIIPLPVWQRAKSALLQRSGKLGLRLTSDAEPTSIAEELGNFTLIAIEFPKFTDGRGYSLARLLRERLGFEGELRAVGDVLRDQLAYMERCGFDAFELRQDKSLEEALGGFDELSVHYQGASDDPRPLFRRRRSSEP